MEEDRLGVINANSNLGTSGKILIINRIGQSWSRTCGGEYKRFPLQVINHYPKKNEYSRTTSRGWQIHSQSIEQALCVGCCNWQVTAQSYFGKPTIGSPRSRRLCFIQEGYRRDHSRLFLLECMGPCRPCSLSKTHLSSPSCKIPLPFSRML